MSQKQSAGLLLFRIKNNKPEVMLIHPGGPFWKNKDAGAWSIPKGEFAENEDPLQAAKRELNEETGLTVEGDFIKLNPVRQKGGKMVYAWAVEADLDVSNIKSNEFEMEWPPRSGKQQKFPEVDKAEWFDLEIARLKINTAQAVLLNEIPYICPPKKGV
jgi:predicted NUDIX family NTP pyrophosphohydrolase